MFCFKDMTFCDSDCTNTKCHRFFGDQKRAEAIVWWGGTDFPIAVANFSKDCDGYKKPRDPILEYCHK